MERGGSPKGGGGKEGCAKKLNLGRVMTSPSTPRFPAALPLPPVIFKP